MSNQVVHAAAGPDPYGWRAGAVRVLANALLVLLAFEVVSLVWVAAAIVAGEPARMPLVELALFAAAFFLARWVFVLPGLLLVLIGIEYVARRLPHARVLTAVVAFAPMVLWELTKSPGGIAELGGISAQGAVLGITAVLFAVLARLPARFPGHSADDPGEAPPPLPVTG